jgi:hypothetical protein
MQPFDETAYRPHVQSMISREKIAELTREGRSADAELADLGEAIHYQLLKANCDTGEGELALQPWLEVERPDLLASDGVIAHDLQENPSGPLPGSPASPKNAREVSSPRASCCCSIRAKPPRVNPARTAGSSVPRTT